MKRFRRVLELCRLIGLKSVPCERNVNFKFDYSKLNFLAGSEKMLILFIAN